MSEDQKKVSLKLLIDTKASKVIFAEARKDFVDFLFNILSLPIGTIIELCSKEGKVGCLSDLCKSIHVLDVDYFEPNVTKNKVTEVFATGINSLDISQNLLLLGDTSTEKKYYRCANSYVNCRNYVSDTANATCPQCGREMSTAATYVKNQTATSGGGGVSQKGYVKGVVTYMVMDNLEVKPMSTISCIALINKFSVVDVSALLEKEVHVGVNEWIAILKASLETRAALTAVFLKSSCKNEEKN